MGRRMSDTLTGGQFEIHQRLTSDHEFFARHIQKIEPKDIEFDDDDQAQFDTLWREDSVAGLVPLVFRPGQMKLHMFVTEMKKRRGLVKAALVKPRQVGWSTIIQARIHWLCSKTKGLKCQIISHNSGSTGKFLRRIRKMCAAAPPTITPGRPLDNSKEIGFSNGAYIGIATAGSPDAVRSDSAHVLHASEETSWDKEMEVWASLMPAMSFAHGSESYRETTSKGRNTPWHNFIRESQAAQAAGFPDWEVFFDPYFNDPRYQTLPPPGWEPDDEAWEHARQHLKHLTEPQARARLYWRHLMIKQLRAKWLFKQEFPSSIDESFQSSEDTLYSPDAVYRAQENGKKNAIPIDSMAPLIMGVDPARTGDRTAICFRQGNVIREVMTWAKMDDMRLVGIIAKFLSEGYNKTPVKKCFIDYAIGEGPASRLRELGFFLQIQAVHFGGSSSEPRYANKRTEMYMDMRDWFGDTGEHVSIPDRGSLIGDLLAIPDFTQSTGSEKIKLPPKDVIKKQYGMSPDEADACVLTFAYPVAAERVAELQRFARENLSHVRPDSIASMLNDFDR